MSERLPQPFPGDDPQATERAGLPAVVPAPPAPLPLGPALGGPEDERVDWRRYLHAVRRHKWLVMLLTVLGVVGGVLVGRFLKPAYAAVATIWIEDPKQGQLNTGPIQQAELVGGQGWVDLMRSFLVLDAVVLDLRLYLIPGSPQDSLALASFSIEDRFLPGAFAFSVDDAGRNYTLTRQDGVVVETGQLGDSVGKQLGFLWAPGRGAVPPGRTVRFRVTSPRDRSRVLARDLQPRIGGGGSFIQVELQGADATLVAATVNAVLKRFVDVAAELKREKLTELTHILYDQLQAAQQNMTTAEIALESFRVRTITLPQDPAAPVAAGLAQTTNPVYQSFFQMRIERDQLRRDREAILAAIAQGADSGVGADALRFIAAVTGSELAKALDESTVKEAELRALRYKYSEEYPPLQRVAADVRVLRTRTIPLLARALADQMVVREAELDSRIGSASAELRQIPARAIEEARLARHVATAENLYVSLRGRYESARIAEMESQPDIRILDQAAVPQKPVASTTSQLFLVGLVGGLGLGVLGAILLDKVDSRVRYPEQVSRDLGLTILGAIPRVRSNGPRGSQDTAQVIEALRGVRLGLMHAYGSAGPILLTVSSPGSGDGKSFVASNLALTFADAGHRTVLIDADVRRGALHRVMSHPRKPGLTDLLAGKATREQVLHETSYQHLAFVPSGTRIQTGPELLGSAAMRELLTSLRASYSAIILDTPPLGAGVDPFLLGTLTGNMLLVLRTGVTSRELAEAKLDMLDRLPIRVLGAILNDVRDDGYGYRLYSYYMPGYEAADEVSGEPAQLPRSSIT